MGQGNHLARFTFTHPPYCALSVSWSPAGGTHGTGLHVQVRLARRPFVPPRGEGESERGSRGEALPAERPSVAVPTATKRKPLASLVTACTLTDSLTASWAPRTEPVSLRVSQSVSQQACSFGQPVSYAGRSVCVCRRFPSNFYHLGLV